MKQHINDFKPVLVSLIKTGRSNPYILAIILTESHFRNSYQRTKEYVLWFLLYLFSPERVHKLSVGIAQIQIRHWVNLNFIESDRPSLSSLQKMMNPYLNYDVCSAFLDTYLNQNISLENISVIYRGRSGVYYCKVLKSAYNYVNNMKAAQHAPNKAIHGSVDAMT
jgi:hypothetical protein